MSADPSPPEMRQLRARAHKLKPIMQIGKEGLSAGVLAKLGELLDEHELVKIKSLDSAPRQKRELAEAVHEATGAEVVTVIGRTITLYRPPAR